MSYEINFDDFDDFDIESARMQGTTYEGIEIPEPDSDELTAEEIEERKKKEAIELAKKGFLPNSENYSPTFSSPQEDVERNPRQYIIEECIPACLELWKKNIYTCMTSDHDNEGQCWIEVIFNVLSSENQDIFTKLQGEDVIIFGYHPGHANFGVTKVGIEGQRRLLELAQEFKMQDVPENHAYISLQDFLIKHCHCYKEVPNPDYVPMEPYNEEGVSTDEEWSDYINKRDDWQHSIASHKTLKVFDPEKLTKPIEDLVQEHGMVLEGDRVYLSPFHYKKHLKYLEHLNTLNEDEKHQSLT